VEETVNQKILVLAQVSLFYFRVAFRPFSCRTGRSQFPSYFRCFFFFGEWIAPLTSGDRPRSVFCVCRQSGDSRCTKVAAHCFRLDPHPSFLGSFPPTSPAFFRSLAPSIVFFDPQTKADTPSSKKGATCSMFPRLILAACLSLPGFDSGTEFFPS